MTNTPWERAHRQAATYLATVRTAVDSRDDASREAAFTHLGRIAREVSGWPLGNRQEFESRLRSSGSRIIQVGDQAAFERLFFGIRARLTLEDGGYLGLELKIPAGGGYSGLRNLRGSFRCYSWLPGFRRPHVFQDSVHPLLDNDYLQAVALFLPLG